jgi:hypothetical protein
MAPGLRDIRRLTGPPVVRGAFSARRIVLRGSGAGDAPAAERGGRCAVGTDIRRLGNRGRIRESASADRSKRRRGQGRGQNRRPRNAAGRWALVTRSGAVVAPDDRIRKFAGQLLLRWGVLFRDLLAREVVSPSWRDLLPVLRRMEAGPNLDRAIGIGLRISARLRGWSGPARPFLSSYCPRLWPVIRSRQCLGFRKCPQDIHRRTAVLSIHP